MTPESNEARLKRMTMRSWRRGTKEMDLILGPFSETALAGMKEGELRLYDQLLSENDQDLYQWVTRQTDTPERFRELLDQIRAAANLG